MDVTADQAAYPQAVSSSSSPSPSTEATIDATFYHCGAGNFWNISSATEIASEGCELCSDAAVGDIEVQSLQRTRVAGKGEI